MHEISNNMVRNVCNNTKKNLGFKLNPYDPCVANLKVNGKQLTIAWYVDDTKISHEDPRVVTWLLNQIDEKIWKK